MHIFKKCALSIKPELEELQYFHKLTVRDLPEPDISPIYWLSSFGMKSMRPIVNTYRIHVGEAI